MELTVQNVYGLLLRSRLMPVEEARAAFERWNAEARERAGDTPAFLRWLMTNRVVTEYQAALLASGYADGFFIHQYRVLDRLGKGRMAGVYKAQHPTGPIVAIKVLPPSRAKDPALFARFQREARLAVKLKHPNVVRTYHVSEWEQFAGKDKLHYLVMEYLEGETLEDLLQRRKQLPPAEAVPLIYQALQGIQHIHSHNLVHRDLKPSNLMVVPPPGEGPVRGTVKILDLGLSRALFDESVQPPVAEQPGLTAEGVLLGTPDYMAPEQARDARSADIRSDIYSIGCVLYHLLAGQPPFPDVNIISQMIRHATEEARPLREFNPAVPDGLQQIVNWMMAKDPAKRYPTPERAAQALQIYLGTGVEDLGTTLDDPSMNQYLTWLELGNPDAPPPEKKADPKPAKPAAVLPKPTPKARVERPPSKEKPRPSSASVKPGPVKAGTDKAPALVLPKEPSDPRMKAAPAEIAPAEPVAVPADKGAEAGAAKKKARGERPERPAAPVVARPALPPGEAFDVELVALPPPGEELPLFSFPLQRRDFVMFGIGVGTAFLGLGLGGLISWGLGRRGKQEDPPPPSD